MRKLISLLLALVMTVTCLAGISFAADPIAKVTTGDKTVEVTTREELVEAISPRGTSVVTLLQDITADTMSGIPVCTLDLNGKTWKTTAGNVLAIQDEKTDDDADNFCTVIKNGTIHGASSAIRHEVGGLKVTNCILRGDGANAIQMLEPKSGGAYNDSNIIENSTLICTITAAVGFNRKNADFSKISYKIENSTLINSTEKPGVVFGKASGTTSGTFVLGKGVKLYSYKTEEAGYAGSGVTVTGEAITKAADTQTVEVLGQSYAGLTMWTTPAAAAPVQPEAPADPSTPAQPETPAAPVQPTTPTVPTTPVPDVEVPKTGASVIALGVMAMASLAGAVITRKH